MKQDKINIISLITAFSLFVILFTANYCYESIAGEKHMMKVGFVYEGDESTPYTDNFIDATRAIEEKFGDSVQCVVKKNVANGSEGKQIEALVEEGCELIFCNSYSYEKNVKEMAAIYPNVQFCQATGDNAGEAPFYDNYHTYMGEIYQGRYVSGVVAGLKLQELIKAGKLKPEEAKVGYVGAFPYPEVISGYTAFIIGIRSVVPEATMKVRYTYSWNNYTLEKEYARNFIDDGCVIISQHSDTAGPAVACEETDPSKYVYHVGYSQDMKKIAPTTHLVSCRINWAPYMVAAVEAVLNKSSIESNLECHVWGKDAGGGFADGWVELLKLNEQVVAEDTDKRVEYIISQLEKQKIDVFKGNYIGVNPDNPEDRYDLRLPFKENARRSSPAFNYILENVVTIEK